MHYTAQRTTTSPSRMPGRVKMVNRLAGVEAEGQDKGVAVKPLQGPASEAIARLPQPVYANPILIGPEPGFRILHRLVALLPDSLWHAAVMVLGDTTASTTEVLGIPPDIYGPCIQVVCNFVLHNRHPVWRTAGVLLGAAATTASELVQLLPRFVQRMLLTVPRAAAD